MRDRGPILRERANPDTGHTRDFDWGRGGGVEGQF